MEYVSRKSTPQSTAMRFSLVILLHLALVAGLMNGLQRVELPAVMRDLNVVFVPLNEPAPKLVEPARKVVAKNVVQPPVPLPDVVIETPKPPVTVSVASSEAPADAPVGVASPGPDTGNLSAAGLAAACPNAQSIRSTMRYPIVARRDGLEGDVLARFVVGANGAIRDIAIVSSSNRVFNQAVTSALAQFSCVGQGRDVAVEVPFSFRLN
jgi:periplasmic protein TonB